MEVTTPMALPGLGDRREQGSTPDALDALFALLGAGERQALGDALRARRFRPQEILFHEGDPGHLLYFIQAGQVRLVQVAPDGAETILHVCGPGESLGELALLDGGPRSATAVALEHVEVLTLSREAFAELMSRHPSVGLALLQKLVGMVRRLNEQVQSLLSLDATGRVARMLLKLAEQHGQQTPRGLQIGMRLSQEQLAQMVGTTRSTVSRLLNGFQSRGILTLERECILIHEPEQLRRRIY